MVIVGAGFIGAEVAAAARHAGCEVTMVDAVEAPLAAVLGPEIAAACSLEHHQHGVRFIGGVTVEAVEGAGRVERVQLSDGRELDADLVLLGVGARPATDWLAGSGLALDDGVLCDETCRTGAPGVYAAGDVARFAHRGYGERIRIEHWANASEMATAAVAAALGDRTPFVPIPSFWSDQYGLRLQTLGRLRPDDVVEIVAGSPEDRRFLALYGRGGRLTGLLTLSWPLMLARHKTLLSSGASWAEALDAVRAPMAVPAAER
jgi:NADPH-dependent 2,4-dienoyl-CoA reductase/sulfur reductase-like enzyme